MKQRKFRKQFWCWTFPNANLWFRNVFMRAHNRKVK
jgi:hypothetical protein